ncbi:MAG: hypothetical protein AB4368_14045 [Xenococcaceae cyanobacterium]
MHVYPHVFIGNTTRKRINNNQNDNKQLEVSITNLSQEIIELKLAVEKLTDVYNFVPVDTPTTPPTKPVEPTEPTDETPPTEEEPPFDNNEPITTIEVTEEFLTAINHHLWLLN